MLFRVRTMLRTAGCAPLLCVRELLGRIGILLRFSPASRALRAERSDLRFSQVPVCVCMRSNSSLLQWRPNAIGLGCARGRPRRAGRLSQANGFFTVRAFLTSTAWSSLASASPVWTLVNTRSPVSVTRFEPVADLQIANARHVRLVGRRHERRGCRVLVFHGFLPHR